MKTSVFAETQQHPAQSAHAASSSTNSGQWNVNCTTCARLCACVRNCVIKLCLPDYSSSMRKAEASSVSSTPSRHRAVYLRGVPFSASASCTCLLLCLTGPLLLSHQFTHTRTGGGAQQRYPPGCVHALQRRH